MSQYEITPIVVDPWANEDEASKEYNVQLVKLDQVTEADCIIIAVGHNEFRNIRIEELNHMFKDVQNSKKYCWMLRGFIKLKN